MRAPSSGGATTRELPDVLYSNVGIPLYAAELKTTSENVAYYEGTEVQALRNVATAFGAQPRLIARYKGDTSYYVFRIDQARKTGVGNYAVDRNIAEETTIEP
jgi:Holliday junction resolvase